MAGERYFRAWQDTHGGWHNADGGDDGCVYATRKAAHEASERQIAAFHAAVDAEAADERRDEALWQAEEARIEQEREAERRALFAACEGDEGPY
jgi:uncharacterized protein YhaN